MPQHVICSNCRQLLKIRDGSPARLTCPKCLGRVVNPHPFRTVDRPAALDEPRDPLVQSSRATPPPLPRRVLPVETDVGLDLSSTIRGIALLSLLFGGTGLLSLTRHGNRSMGLMGVVVTILLAAFIFYWWRQNQQLDGWALAGKTLRGCLLMLLIGLGVIGLLVGLCIAAIVGANALGMILCPIAWS